MPTHLPKHPLLTVAVLSLCSLAAQAADNVVDINLREHKFEPTEIQIPANTKVKLQIHNLDVTPEEFESYELKREKVIAGKTTGVVFVGPLKPGSYPFFGEFNPATAQGRIIVK